LIKRSILFGIWDPDAGGVAKDRERAVVMKGVVQWRSRMPAKGRLQTYGGSANLFRASMQLLNRTNLNSSSPQLRDPTTQVNVKKSKILVIDRKNQKYEMGMDPGPALENMGGRRE